MRIAAKRTKLLFALLPMMAIIFYALTYSPELKASVTFKPVQKVDNIVALKEVPTSGTPSDYSPLENAAIANYILFNASYFQGVSNGSVEAKVGFINYNQTVYGMRKVKDGNILTQSISTSSLKNIAEQQYIAGDTYLYRPGSKIKGNSAEFGDVFQMSGDAYMIKYGMPPKELCKYVLKEETVLESKLISFPAVAGEGDYVFGFTLDPQLSTEYYQNEVRTLSGSSSEYPQFESVYIEITIDSNWYAKSFTVTETYWIDKPVKAVCSATLTEVFSDINDPQDVPEAEPFLSFVPEQDPNGGNQYTPPTDPTDYLAAAFGKYIQGEPLNLDCNISLPAYKLDLNVKLHIDLEHKFADILLADDLYIGYRGDTVYFAAGTLKGSMRTDAFAALLPDLLQEAQLVSPKLQAFLKDFDFDAFKGDSLMELLFADAEVIKTETETAIVMPFMLSGVRFDIRMNLSAEPYEFRSIDAKISILTVGADVSVVPCDSISFPAIDGSYRDLTAAADFILPALRTAGLPAYRLTVNGSFTTPRYSDTVAGELHIDRALNAVGTLALGKIGKSVGLTHIDNALYVSVDGMTLSMPDSALIDLLPIDTSAQPNVDLSTLDLGAILSGLTELTVDSNTLRATLAIDGVPVSVALRHNGEILTYLHVELPDVNGMYFAFDVDLAASAAPIAVEKPENAVSALAVYDYVKPLLANVRQAGEIRLTLQDATVYGLPIGGYVRVGLHPLYVEADLSVDGVPVRAVLAADETVNAAPLYVSVGNARFKTTVDKLPTLLSEVLALFGVDAPQPSISIPSLSAFSLDENGLHISSSGMTVRLKIGEQTTISVSGDNVDVRAAATFGDGNAPTVEGDYTDLTYVVGLLKSAMTTIRQGGFSVSGTAAVDFDSLQDTATYSVAFDKAGNVRASVSLVNMGISADITKIGNKLYIECGLFRVRLPLGDASAQKKPLTLPKFVTDLLPESVVKMIAGNTPTASDIVALIPYLTTLSVTDSTATVRIDTDKLSLDVSAGYGLYVQSATVALNLPRTDKTPITLNASAALAVDGVSVQAPTGDFVDLEKQPLLSILEGKALSAPFAVDVATENENRISLTGTATVAVTDGKPQLALSVDVFDTLVDIRLWNDCLYLRVGNLKISFDAVADRKALLDFADKNLPSSIQGVLTKAFSMYDRICAFGWSDMPVGDQTVDVDTLLKNISVQDGLTVTAGGTIRMPWPKNGSIANISADFAVQDTTVGIRLTAPTLSAVDRAFTLQPLDAADYTPLKYVLAFADSAMTTAEQNGFSVSGTAAVDFDSLQDTATYSVAFDKAGNVRASVSLVNMGISADITKIGNELYIECGLFRVRLPLVDASTDAQKKPLTLPKFVTDLLPESVVKMIGGNTPTASDIVALIPYLTTLSVTDSTATVRIDTDKLSLDVSADYGLYVQSATVALNLPRTDKTPITLNTSAALAVDGVSVQAPTGDFVDLEKQPLLSILEGKALSADIATDVVVTKDGETVADVSIAGCGTPSMTIAVLGGKPQVSLSVNAFDTQVDIRLWNDCLYLRVGDLKISLNITDERQTPDTKTARETLLDFFGSNLPFARDLLDKAFDMYDMLCAYMWTDMPRGNTALDLDALLADIDLSDGLALLLPVGKATANIRMPWPKNGAFSTLAADFAVNDTVVGITLHAPKLAAVGEGFDLKPVDAETYADFAGVAAFVPAIMHTVDGKRFRLAAAEDITIGYQGKRYDANIGTTPERVQKLDAEGKPAVDKNNKPILEYKTKPVDSTFVIAAGSTVTIIPEGTLNEGNYFINFFADITFSYDECVIGKNKLVQARRCTDNIKATLVRETVDGKTQRNIYLDYKNLSYVDERDPNTVVSVNGESTKLKLSYEEALGILGYAKKILGLKDTVLDKLTDGHDYYNEEIDTSIFDRMDLTALRATLTEMLDLTERILNVVTGDDSHASLLQSIADLRNAPTFGKALDAIHAIRSVLADNGFADKKADEDIVANFGAALSAVGKLTLSFDDGSLALTMPTQTGTDSPCVTLRQNGSTLSRLDFTAFDFGTVQMHGGLTLDTCHTFEKDNFAPGSCADGCGLTVTPPAGSGNTFNLNPTAAERTLWNDLGPISELLETFIHTANLGRFHIGGAGNTEYGKIHMSIPDFSVNIDIPFVVKVDFIDDSPAVYVEFDFSKIEANWLGNIASKFALAKNVSRLFYYDGRFLLSRTLDSQRLNSTPTFFETTHVYQTQYVAATLNDLIRKDENGNMDTAQLMKYVYFLFPLSGSIQTPINTAVEQGITNDFNAKSQVLNRFSYYAPTAKTAFNLDVGELSRIKDIYDASVELTTGTDGNGNPILHDFFADIWFLKNTSPINNGIGMTVTAQLVAPGQDVGTVRYTDWQAETQTTKVWDGYNVREEVKEASVMQIPALIDRLSAFTDTNDNFAGTIEKPYVSTQKYMRLKK